AWSRWPRARSAACIAAILASTVPSPSASPAFSSRTRSRIAAFSSAVNPLAFRLAAVALVDFFAGFFGLMETSSCGVGLLVAGPKEGQDVAVGVGDLEAPQAVVDIRQLFDERGAPPLELGEERVGVQGVDIGIPARPGVTGVV